MYLAPGYTEQDYAKAYEEFMQAHNAYRQALDVLGDARRDGLPDSIVESLKQVFDVTFDKRIEKWAILMRVTGELPAED